ncbi:hypothetical protein [Kibdelosporangium aridum]|uniref:hypothetical protein n=1 Tax=Kibdelosporangium aridum TaxID=2030 RepID=UPI000524A5B6
MPGSNGRPRARASSSRSNTGKLKRLRNNSRVIVAPCNSAGTIPPGAESIEGTGRILDTEETHKAYKLMARKTPLARLARAWYVIRRKPEPWVGIEATVGGEAGVAALRQGSAEAHEHFDRTGQEILVPSTPPADDENPVPGADYYTNPSAG